MATLTAMLEALARPLLKRTALAMFDQLVKEFGRPAAPDTDGYLFIPRADFPRFLTALRDQARARLKGIL
jgi:hypothetical protein